MSGMDDLIIWLPAQMDEDERELDEDERVAREATPGPWAAEPVVYGPPDEGWGEPSNYEVVAANKLDVVSHYMYEGGGTDRENGEHIARWDPDRVLKKVAIERADLDAKRRILDRYESLRRSPGTTTAAITLSDARIFEYETRIIPALALPYAGRDGYREEWRP